METEIFLGRQPIFDSEGRCYGYELLHRNKDQTTAVIQDDAKATARVIINTVHNIGFESIISDKIGFINVDDHSLLSDALLSLPKERFVFEILEYTNMSVAIVERIKHLHELGYRFAIDDFCCKSANLDYFRLILPYVDIVKIDLLATHSITIEDMAEQFAPYHLKLLAEKIENMEMFERCRKAGFSYFQGYFFEKPTILVGKKLEPSMGNVIDLINTFYVTSDISVIAEKFSHYPELTFNLLRYVNSSSFNFKTQITSIRQILTLLGPSRLRSWLGLFLYAGSSGKMFREAFFEAAKFRAKMMQELVTICGKAELADEAFLTGSLSLIDAYFQIDMQTILEKIRLSPSITDALLLREGYLGKLLNVTEKLETTEDIQAIIEYLAPKVDVSPHDLYQIYLDANLYMSTKE